ncbi:hypothetical protein HMPREF1484_00219 [Dermabacter sp. HFH0086]|nr:MULTISPECIES: hypothetical protein [Dermabacter]EPH17534.1 hypothetical protein HMPREF1484_00219 [Dermabacter sp. HFH0086]
MLLFISLTATYFARVAILALLVFAVRFGIALGVEQYELWREETVNLDRH